LLASGVSMIACSASSGQARAIAERLVGVAVPSLVLDDCWKVSLDLAIFAGAHPVVLYFFPGCSGSPDDGERADLMDVVQHRAFRHHLPDLEARGYTVIGVSSQSDELQRRTARANRLAHRLLCDPELQLAQALELPTFSCDDAHWYQRLTLIAGKGRVEKLFFPVANAAASASQVLTWLTLHRQPIDASDDAC
jgi:peroxiredoxin